MSWNTLPPHIRHTAETTLTQHQLDALKLWENGYGYRRIALTLGISMTTARGRVNRALDKLNHQLAQEPDGHITYSVRITDRQAVARPTRTGNQPANDP